MKSLVLFITLVLSFSAFSGTRTVKGSLASLLSDFAGKYGNSDAAMGHYYSNTDSVVCSKIVDDANYDKNEIVCTVKNGTETKKITTKKQNQYEEAIALRRLLSEITNADKKVSSNEMKLVIKSISCSSLSSAFLFDSLELEPGSTCKVTF